LLAGHGEEDVRVERAVEPGVVGQFRFQLARFPAGITQGDQALLWPYAFGDGEQHVLRSGQRQALQFDGGLVAAFAAVQDEAAVSLHRATLVDGYVQGAGRRYLVGAQLLENVGQVQLLWSVDHQAHGAIGVVLDDVREGLGEVRIGHVRHGDQELMLEVARGEGFHGG